MKEEYEIEIHNMTKNRIDVYEVLATSFEDAYLQAKVLHNHFMYVLERNAELISIIKKQNNENE